MSVSADQSCNGAAFGLLVGLSEQVFDLLERSATSVGLTTAQARLLTQLPQPMRMSEVAQQRLCDPSSLTTLAQRMERDGYVERIVDPTDARARLLRLTAKGRRARQRFLTAVADGRPVLDALSAEQRSALRDLFTPTP